MSWSPYTLEDDDTTTRSTPCSRAAWSTFSVPFTFTACVPMGSSTDCWTRGRAARWNTHAAPSTAASTASASATDPSTSSAPGFSCSRFPDERSSSTATSYPSPTSASTMCDPINPHPPVTTQRMAAMLREGRQAGSQTPARARATMGV